MNMPTMDQMINFDGLPEQIISFRTFISFSEASADVDLSKQIC